MRHFLALLSDPLLIIACAVIPPTALSAPATDTATTARVTVRGTEIREFDWAKSRARAHVAYTSSGPRTLSGRMIDNDLQTVFRFSESDKTPTVIVELAQSARLHRVSTAFKAEDAQLDVYLLNELPKDPGDLRVAKPDASVNDRPDDNGMVNVNFSVSSARYVVLRWKRNRWQEPFEVAEISAFSNDPADFIFDQAPQLADNMSAAVLPAPPPVPVVSP
jgi:hypothetical protein